MLILDSGSDSNAERVWWTRLERAAERRGQVGSKLMSDWTHDMVEVLSAEDVGFELFDSRWQPIPPERLTEDSKAAESRRLCDQLGRDL